MKGFVGAVNGKVLLNFIEKSNDEEIGLNLVNSKLTVISGNSKLELALIPENDFPFHPSEPTAKFQITDNEIITDFLTNLSLSLSMVYPKGGSLL